jgi:hypothetical protein
VIWLRYSQQIQSSGGLYGFVRDAAGPRVAAVQAAIWTFSYLLYIIYTTIQIVYDLLPDVVSGERHYRTLLALLIPVLLAAVMVAGRRPALIASGLIAAIQLILAVMLGGITLAHLSPVVSGAHQSGGDLLQTTAQSSLLYICGSLPLFLGGELARPAVTIKRGLIGAYVVTVLLVAIAVVPLAGSPQLLDAPIPGMAVIAKFSGHGLAEVLGIGIALSIAGVMLAEYVAVGRLLHAVGGWHLRPVNAMIAVIVVVAAPLTLIDPSGIYSALIKPSLVALWLSQLIVFAVYPRFARKHGQRLLPAWTLTIVAGALAVYGVYITIHHPAS